jgi:hypothetical protein
LGLKNSERFLHLISKLVRMRLDLMLSQPREITE